MSRIFLTIALLAAVQCTFGAGLVNGFGGEYYYEGGEGGEGGEGSEGESESESSESESSDSSTCTPCGPIGNGECCDDCPICEDHYAACLPHTHGKVRICDCIYGYTLCDGKCVPSCNCSELDHSECRQINDCCEWECFCPHGGSAEDNTCCVDCHETVCCTKDISAGTSAPVDCNEDSEEGECFCEYGYAVNKAGTEEDICCDYCDATAWEICCKDEEGCLYVSAGHCYCAHGMKPNGECCPTPCPTGETCNDDGYCEPGTPPGEMCGPSAPSCNRDLGIKCENVLCCGDADDVWPPCSEKFCVCETEMGFKWDNVNKECEQTGLKHSELTDDCENSIGPRENLSA